MAPLSWNLKNKCINSNFSTIFSLLWVWWVSKEAKNLNKVELFGLVHCFSPKIEETSKKCQKMTVFSWVLWFFEVFSILAEKQHTKPIDSSSLMFFASFDTCDTPRSTKIVEKLLFIHLFLRIRDSGTPRIFFLIFKIKPDVYF